MAGEITLQDRFVLEFLGQLGRKAENLGGLMDSIGQEMEARVSDRFETESDPSGTPWMGWADSTIESYPDDGNGMILDRYGQAGMLGSLNYQADATSVTYGFAMPYAAYHEFGTDRMPRRGLLTLDPEAGTLSPGDEASILETVQAYLLTE